MLLIKYFTTDRLLLSTFVLSLRAPYDANQPIETIIDQVKTAVEYAAADNTPYSPAQVVDTAYQLVFQTDLFNNNCKVWKRQEAAYKTWANFKADFSTAHLEWR